jgi:hypothetical protein
MAVFFSSPNWLVKRIKLPVLLELVSVSIDFGFWPHQRHYHAGEVTVN